MSDFQLSALSISTTSVNIYAPCTSPWFEEKINARFVCDDECETPGHAKQNLRTYLAYWVQRESTRPPPPPTDRRGHEANEAIIFTPMLEVQEYKQWVNVLQVSFVPPPRQKNHVKDQWVSLSDFALVTCYLLNQVYEHDPNVISLAHLNHLLFLNQNMNLSAIASNSLLFLNLAKFLYHKKLGYTKFLMNHYSDILRPNKYGQVWQALNEMRKLNVRSACFKYLSYYANYLPERLFSLQPQPGYLWRPKCTVMHTENVMTKDSTKDPTTYSIDQIQCLDNQAFEKNGSELNQDQTTATTDQLYMAGPYLIMTCTLAEVCESFKSNSRPKSHVDSLIESTCNDEFESQEDEDDSLDQLVCSSSNISSQPPPPGLVRRYDMLGLVTNLDNWTGIQVSDDQQVLELTLYLVFGELNRQMETKQAETSFSQTSKQRNKMRSTQKTKTRQVPNRPLAAQKASELQPCFDRNRNR